MSWKAPESFPPVSHLVSLVVCSLATDRHGLRWWSTERRRHRAGSLEREGGSKRGRLNQPGRVTTARWVSLSPLLSLVFFCFIVSLSSLVPRLPSCCLNSICAPDQRGVGMWRRPESPKIPGGEQPTIRSPVGEIGRFQPPPPLGIVY